MSSESIDKIDTRRPPGPPPPGSVKLLQMLTAPWISQALYVVAKFDLADRMAAGPRPVGELASAAGLHEDTVFRLLRALAAMGVVTETEPRTFALTDLGQYLRGDVPGTQKYSALLFGEQTFQAWGNVVHTSRTGEPAFDAVFGQSFYDFLNTDPEAAETFNRVMGVAGAVPPATKAFDFSGRQRLVDVGGGTGVVLADILSRTPGLTGALVDLPDAVSEAEGVLATAGVRDRVELTAGSFFDHVPSDGDVYLLTRVLHNWNDDDAVTILRNVRAAMRSDGQLIVCERFLPAGDEYHIGKIFDLVMLVVLGGRDRTGDEYRYLLTAAGFEVTDQIPGPADIGLMVASPKG